MVFEILFSITNFNAPPFNQFAKNKVAKIKQIIKLDFAILLNVYKM